MEHLFSEVSSHSHEEVSIAPKNIASFFFSLASATRPLISMGYVRSPKPSVLPGT